MKRLIPIFALIVLTSLLAHSQITVSLDPPNFVMNGPASQTDIAYHVKVINTSNQVASLLWTRRVTGAPVEWWTWICDANLCYDPAVSACPESKPNVLQPGDSIDFQMHMNPRNVEGTASFDVNITDMEGNTLAVIDGEVCIPTCITGTKDASDVRLTIFPNPAVDYFQISDLPGLKSIELFNLVGTKIKSFEAAPQKQYFVGDLTEGIYLVRLISSNKKILKTVRLSVR